MKPIEVVIGLAIMIAVAAYVIIGGGIRLERDRQACRDRGFVPVTYGGRTECVKAGGK